MKRYYFNEPLQAAYMAKTFGMVIVGESANDWPTTDICFYASCLYEESQSPSDPVQHERAYVQEGSLHLLEPQIGDIVLNCDDDPARVVPDHKQGNIFTVPLSVACQWVGKEATIIQRGGKPFFWPELK